MSMFPYNSQSDEYSYPPSKKNITSFQEDEKYQCMSPYGPVSNANCPADFPYCNCNSKIFEDFNLRPEFVELTDQQLANLRNGTKECDLIQSKLGYSWFGIDYSEPHSSYNCICFNGDSETTNDYKSIPGLSSSWKKYIEIKSEEEEESDCAKDPQTGEELGACCSTLDGCFVSTSARCPQSQRISWTRCKTCQEVNCNQSGLLPLSAETNQTGSSNQSNQTGSSNNPISKKIVRYTNENSASADKNLLFFNYDHRNLFDGNNNAFPLPVSEIPNPEEDKVCSGPILGPNFKYYKEYSKTNATFWNTPPRTPLLRRAQTALINAQRVKILVHGNTDITPGTIVNIDYFNFGGRWMVYRVERTITAQRHSMYLYLMRDGTL